MMNRSARKAAEGTDVVALLLDASTAPRVEDEGWLKRLCAGRDGAGAWMIVLSKSDLGAPFERAYREMLARLRTAAAEAGAPPLPEPAWIRVSAATGDGLDILLDRVFALAPEHPPLFPDNIVTDFPRKLFIADVVREKLFLRLHEELPHRVAAWVEDLQETPDGWDVTAVVYVERPSQQGIVIGYKGRQIRAVRRASEAELEAIYGHPVRLSLTVKVEKNWTKNFWFLKKTGLDL
jgi:GTPase Era involved in 16S rRNA processing